MKKFLLFTIYFLTCSIFLFAQSEEAFQEYLAKIRPILTKNVEKITNVDLQALNSAMALEPTKYGEANKRLCLQIKSEAATKVKEYNAYLEQLQNMSKTLDELDAETTLRQAAELKNDSLTEENVRLYALIDDLNYQISQYKKQISKVKQVNKKIQDENIATKEILQNSSNLVAQMLLLFPDDIIDNDLMQDVPKTITDSLADMQCSIANLLKTNFMTTLQSMRSDNEFMDTAAVYFAENHKHTDQITNYIEASNKLVAKLRSSNVDCAISQADNIENELNDFLLEIERRGNDVNSPFVQFLLDNLVWLLIILALVIGLIILIVKNKKQKI